MPDIITSGDRKQAAGAYRPYTFDRVVRILIAVGGFIGALWLLNILKGVLLPFLVAWLIAYILEPLVQHNKRLMGVRKRWLPIMATLFECALVLCAAAVFIVPSVIEEMHQVAGLLSEYTTRDAQIAFIPESLHHYLKENIDFRKIAAGMTRQDWNTILKTIGTFIAGSYNVVMDIFSWFVVLLYVVFIMLDYERLLRGFRRMIPPKYRQRTLRITNDIKSSMNLYFRGQALVAAIVGILFCIGFLIVGLPLAVVLGLFIGVLNMVPYLQLISLIPTTLLCIVYSANTDVDFWGIWWACMAVYVVVQCIQDLFLTPKIMGKAMGLNPALILLSLSVWGTLLGFIGLIIALPLTTLLLAYYNTYITSREDGETPLQRDRDAAAIRRMTESPDDGDE